MLYVQNWREIFSKVSYWSIFGAPSPLNHTWSLAIEEQFYLVWPLVFFALIAIGRRRRGSTGSLAGRTLVLSILLAAGSLASTAWWYHVDGWDRVYYGTDTRAFAILVGAAVAAARARHGTIPAGRPRRVLEAAGVVAFVVLAIAWIGLGEQSWLLHHGGLAACSLAAAVVIAAASHPARGPLARALSFAPLRWLGLISYGVYLYHWPIIVWLDADRTGLDGWTLIGLQVGVTLAIASASFLIVERPIRHRRSWPHHLALAVPTAGFAVVGAVLVASTVGYLPLDALRVPRATPPRPSPDGPRIMVVGDSVPDFITKEGIVYLRSDPQPSVLNLTVQGCGEPPTDSIRYADGSTNGFFAGHCDNGWLDKARTFRPDFVVYETVGVEGAAYHHDGAWLTPCSAGFETWVTERIHTLASDFGRHGAKLVVVTSVPEEPRGRTDGEYRSYLDRNACWNTALRRAVATSAKPVVLVDLARRFCTDDRSCRLHSSSGPVTREDGAHFRGRSAQIIARIILDRMGIDARLPH